MDIQLFEPYEAQKQILARCIEPYSGKIIFTIINASRQSGKSLLIGNVALYWAMTEVQTILMVTPRDSQTKALYKDILASIIEANIIKSSKIQSEDCEIIFVNGSKIMFRSAGSANTLRGIKCQTLILDEAAFIPKEVYDSVLSPMLSTAGKRCIMASSPFGLNWFHTFFMKGLSNDPNDSNYKSFSNNYKDNPYSNKDFIEEEKRRLPESLFRQEYLAEFISAGSIFANFEKYCVLNIRTNRISEERLFCGIDISFSETGDFTVLSIFNDKSELVFIDRFRESSNSKLVSRLASWLNVFKPIKTMVETNNMGGNVLSQLKEFGIENCEGFVTSTSSKKEIINKFAYDLNLGKIKLLNNSDLIKEFGSFSFTLGENGHIRYQAQSGSNDDIVMSVLIAYNCLEMNKYSGQLFFN